MYNSFNYRVRETESCMDQVSAAAVNHKRERQRESEWERERREKKRIIKGRWETNVEEIAEKERMTIGLIIKFMMNKLALNIHAQSF